MAIKLPREVADWEQKFNRCNTLRTPFEQKWYLNLAFYTGRQYAQWFTTDSGIAQLIEPKQASQRVRLISNKVRPAVRREIVKLTKEEPQAYVSPNTTESEDVMAALAAEAIADYSFNEFKFNNARRKATFWTSTCGTGFVKTFCNGVDLPIIYETPTPFHMFVPFIQEEELEAQPFVIEGKAVPCESIYEKWNVEVQPDAKTDSSHLEQRFFNALGIRGDTGKDLVYVKEIWIKPCKNYPTGGLVVIAGKKIVYSYEGLQESKDNYPGQDSLFEVIKEPTTPVDETKTLVPTPSDYPWEHGKYPYDKIVHIPSGGFYGSSFIEDLIPLQKEYNRSRSQITENKNLTSKPPLFYYKGSIEPNKIQAKPGQMIPVNPGYDVPQYGKPPELPQYVLQEIDRIQSDIDDITSQGAISKGKAPPGVEAASAIAYLSEENDDILYHTVASIEDAVSSIGKKTLSLVQQFWTQEKLIKVVSKNNALETLIFKSSDIKDNTDFRVESQSMAPRSRAAKQAFIVGLIKDMVITPEQGLRYLQMNETNRLYDELQADRKHAQRENFEMAHGTPVLTNEFDNDPIHIDQHGLYMKSQEYALLDDGIKQVFLQHYMMHKQKQIQQQMILAQGPPGQENMNEGQVQPA